MRIQCISRPGQPPVLAQPPRYYSPLRKPLRALQPTRNSIKGHAPRWHTGLGREYSVQLGIKSDAVDLFRSGLHSRSQGFLRNSSATPAGTDERFPLRFRSTFAGMVFAVRVLVDGLESSGDGAA